MLKDSIAVNFITVGSLRSVLGFNARLLSGPGRLSRKQVQVNLKHEGGFLGMLASLAARILPTLHGGLATGLVSGAVEKAVSGSGLYLQKKGSGNNAARIHLVKGNGFISLHIHQS